MKRLYLILGTSHTFMIGGAVFFYVSPCVVAALSIVLGLFIRGMVPYENHQAKAEGNRRFRRSIPFLLGYIIVQWLCGFGLREVVEKAWQARFSFLPLCVFILSIGYLTVTDWMWILTQPKVKIDEFYSTPK